MYTLRPDFELRTIVCARRASGRHCDLLPRSDRKPLLPKVSKNKPLRDSSAPRRNSGSELPIVISPWMDLVVVDGIHLPCESAITIKFQVLFLLPFGWIENVQ